MSLRPYWQFYKDIFPFVLATGLILMAFCGIFLGYMLYITFGLAMGFAGFNSFKKDEYYLYYNLGISKKKLAKISFAINAILGIPICLIIFTLYTIITGQL